MISTKKLRIGIIHNTYLKKGGEDQVAENEYRLLQSDQQHVFFLTYTNPKKSVNQLLVYLISPFNLFSYIRCYRWLKRNKINVLHVHNWFFAASPAVIWAAKKAGVPVIMTLHNYRLICPTGTLSLKGKPYLKSLTHPFSWNAVKDGAYRDSKILTIILAFTLWLHNRIGTWRTVNSFIVLTEDAKNIFDKSYLRYLQPKLKVKPNFIYGPKTAYTGTRQKHFLFVGRLSEEKGIRLLLKAFGEIPYQLRIIGDGPLKAEVENFVQHHANVTYLGFQQKAEIDRELQHATALIFPSIWTETFGLILIEAFAQATPVIAPNSGSAGIIVQNGINGIHFGIGNVTDLKIRIQQWAAFDEEKQDAYRRKAFDSYLSNYTAEKNLEQLKAIYNAAINTSVNHE